MKPKEMPLAGYLLARAAMHRKIEGPDLKNLRNGHESMLQVSDLMPLGRSNVVQDINKAKNDHLPQRTMATSNLLEMMIARQGHTADTVPDSILFQLFAAVSQHAKTGICSSYSMSTTPVHAAKLADLKDRQAVVAQSRHDTVDHSWSEMIPKGMRADETPILSWEDVIMDGWCKNNLAILREDGKFSRLDKDGKPASFSHQLFLNRESGPRTLRSVEKFKAQIENTPALERMFRTDFDHFVAAGAQPRKESLWRATSVFHKDFEEQAARALDKAATASPSVAGAGVKGADPVSARAKRASLTEIQAVGVARSLGSNIRGAIAEAPKIIATAKELFPESKSSGSRLPSAEGSASRGN
ncbi:MAG TPA: hypothetical protein VK465_06325 [Fibrobacteria bacterium]|nr:hypothetical protein [Fibrobacteria bacterium]